jgi:1-phosphofructokinase
MKLQQMGAVNVLISRGKDGAVLLTQNNVFSAKAPKGELVNSVGAGDSMLAGFIKSIRNKVFDDGGFTEYTEKDYRLALYYAVATGSAKTFTAGFPEKEEIDEMYEKVLRINL